MNETFPLPYVLNLTQFQRAVNVTVQMDYIHHKVDNRTPGAAAPVSHISWRVSCIFSQDSPVSALFSSSCIVCSIYTWAISMCPGLFLHGQPHVQLNCLWQANPSPHLFSHTENRKGSIVDGSWAKHIAEHTPSGAWLKRAEKRKQQYFIWDLKTNSILTNKWGLVKDKLWFV